MTTNNQTSSPNGDERTSADEYMEKVIQEMGGIHVLVKELKDFKNTVRTFQEDEPHLVKRYNNQWVAYHDCRLRAHAESLDFVLERLREQGIPKEDSLVRFVTDKPRKFIL